MKTFFALSFRKWLLLFMIVFIGLPFFSTALIGILFNTSNNKPQSVPNGDPLLVRKIVDDIFDWTDLQWQEDLNKNMLTSGMKARLVNSKGQEIYSNIQEPDFTQTQPKTTPNGSVEIEGAYIVHTHLVEEHAVYSGSKLLGTAYIYVVFPPTQPKVTTPFNQAIILFLSTQIKPFTWMITALFVLLGFAWFLRKSFLQPLLALVHASTQVAAGDLLFDLPKTKVKEIAEVTDAFRAMGVALTLSIEKQATMEEERRLFIASIIHDLRTPIFSIRGYLEGIQKGIANTPEKFEHYVDVCQDKANLLNELITDLFDYMQFEYLQKQPKKESIDGAKLIEDIIEGFRLQALEKNIHLIFKTGQKSYLFQGDTHLLTRAANNLLDNAICHTPENGEITVSCSIEMDQFVFTIFNTGKGIDPAILPHIFKPLYRGDTSRNRRTGGSGLGLSIARNILLAHGGDLIATNVPTGGALFIGCIALTLLDLPSNFQIDEPRE